MSRLIGGLVVLLGLAGAGAGAWWWVEERPVALLLESGEEHLAAGRLMDAAGNAALLRADRPEDPAGWLLGAKVAIARLDDTAALELLDKAWYLAPHGFPMIAERSELRLRGPSDPKRGFDELAAIDSHMTLFPDDAALVAPARLATLAWILAQPSLSGEQREITLKTAEKVLDEPVPVDAGTHYLHDRAQLLLTFGRREDALATAKAGYLKNDDTWRALLLKWSVASAFMHDKRDEESYRLLSEVHATLLAWEGVHYGMGMPMLEFVELTAQVRFGQVLSAPGRADRLAELDKQGVHIPREVVEIRTLIGELRDALRAKNSNGARERAEALLAKVRPGDGTPLENELILPSVIAIVRVCLGDILVAEEDYSAADRNYRVALIDWPDDLWIDGKVGSVFVKAQGEGFDPVQLPRGEGVDEDALVPRF